MAGEKISQLPNLDKLTGVEKIPVSLNETNYSISTSLFAPFVFTWKPSSDKSFDQLIQSLTNGIPVVYKVSSSEVYPVIGYSKIGENDVLTLWAGSSSDAMNAVVEKDATTGGVKVVSMDSINLLKSSNAGTEGQILKIVGGKPTWVDPS